MQNETVELSNEALTLQQKRDSEQAMLNSLPEDESDGPNVCISCQ